ncbi:MAG TPA: ferredoxin [Ruminococcus sp.]|nr:ferredoxin [Ruminococcus sp.]
MIRKIIKIDENKCTGCGVCADACHEGAIGMIDGKAKLLREDYCDGLGDCLPACPVNAISFEEREASAYNETAVLEAKKLKENIVPLPCGCPGMQSRILNNNKSENCEINAVSCLSQWPVQIKLVPVNAPYFSNANLLVSADCTAYAYGNFHERFIKNHITLIGCPKLDDGDYSEKLTQIIAFNTIKSITVVRMEVPCCSGLQKAVEKALKNSGKQIPCKVVIISADGRILN